MWRLDGMRAVVAGGTRGLGLGIVASLAAGGAEVIAIGRDASRADAVQAAGAQFLAGNAADSAFMERTIAETEPATLILNAGAIPVMASLENQTWESFCAAWDTDVKAGFAGIQAVLKHPPAQRCRVLVTSSGAAMAGAPLSGSYAGAKRMLWFMAQYANAIAAERGLGTTFQVLVPMQMIGTTRIVETVAGCYAERAGVSIEAFLSGRYQKPPLSERAFGDFVATIVSDPAYADGFAFGIDSMSGITRIPD